MIAELILATAVSVACFAALLIACGVITLPAWLVDEPEQAPAWVRERYTEPDTGYTARHARGAVS